jgi:hypothetical protein
MNCAKRGPFHLEDLAILDITVTLIGTVLIYFDLWTKFFELDDPTHMIHVSMSENCKAFGFLSDKDVLYSFDP